MKKYILHPVVPSAVQVLKLVARRRILKAACEKEAVLGLFL